MMGGCAAAAGCAQARRTDDSSSTCIFIQPKKKCKRTRSPDRRARHRRDHRRHLGHAPETTSATARRSSARRNCWRRSPRFADVPLEVEQVAQIDSKDMSHAIWRALAAALERQLERPEVTGVVVTHGTDTLEETAYFLQRVLAPAKPVVLVAAMRPSTSLQADGPQNLLDAFSRRAARRARAAWSRCWPARCMVPVMCARCTPTGSMLSGRVTPAVLGVRSRRGACNAIGTGRTPARRHGLARLPRDPAAVAAGRDRHQPCRRGAACPGAGLVPPRAWQGIVVATTGNGSIHEDLQAALVDAQAAGVAVLRSSRTLGGQRHRCDRAGGTAVGRGAHTGAGAHRTDAAPAGRGAWPEAGEVRARSSVTSMLPRVAFE